MFVLFRHPCIVWCTHPSISLFTTDKEKNLHSTKIVFECMCEATSKPQLAQGTPEMTKGQRLFLFSTESFSGHDKGVPGSKSLFATGAVVVAFLLMVELSVRQFFHSIQVKLFIS